MKLGARPTFFDATNSPRRKAPAGRSTGSPTSMLNPAGSAGASGSGASGDTPPGTGSLMNKSAYFARGFGDHLGNPELADVELRVPSDDGTETTFPCHSLILSFGSEYFKRTFLSDDWRSKVSSGGKTWELDDVLGTQVNATVFRDLLKFLYEGSVELDEKNLIALLHISKKLGVNGLKDACMFHLEEALSAANSVSLAVQAERWKEDQVEGACLEVIAGHFDEIAGQNESAFIPLSLTQMQRLLARKDLHAEREETTLMVARQYITEKQPPLDEAAKDSLVSLVKLPYINASELFQLFEDRAKLSVKDELITEALAARLTGAELSEMKRTLTTGERTVMRTACGLPVVCTPGFALLRIPDFLALMRSDAESIRSATFHDMDGVEWSLLVYPKGSETMENCVGVYLQVGTSKVNVARIREIRPAAAAPSVPLAAATEDAPPAGVVDAEVAQPLHVADSQAGTASVAFKVARMIRVTALNQHNAAGSIYRASAKEFTHEQNVFGWPSFLAHTAVAEFVASDKSLTLTVHLTGVEK